MVKDIISKVEPKMQEAVKYLETRLKSIRTGGAQTGLVEDISVRYYGTPQPLKSLAQITSPDLQQILIQPFDRQAIDDIELAIRNALELNPSSDGHFLRISIPPLTEERRQELVKLVKKYAEEARITLRNIREEAWKQVGVLHQQKQITDDDRVWAKDKLNEIIDKFNRLVEEKMIEKEEVLLRV